MPCLEYRLKMPIRLAAFAFAVLVFAAGCGGGQGKPAGEDPTVLARYRVERGDLDITITENGQLKSAKPVLITIGEPGKVLWIVKEGSNVVKGDKLLQLENTQLMSGIEQARVSTEGVRRALMKAESELKLYELEADKLIKDAERAVTLAKLALEQYREGKASLRDEELALEVKRATIDRDDAKEKSDRMPALLAKGFVTAAEARSLAIEAEQKESAARRKVRELEIFRKFEQPQDLAKLQSEVTAAEFALKRVVQQIAATRSDKESEVAMQRSQLDIQKLQSTEFLERVKKLTVVAPSDGLVVYGDPSQRRWNPTRVNVGTELYQNYIVMELPDLNAMVAEIGVSEFNVNRVAVGQAVKVTIEGLGGKSFDGKLASVDSTAQEGGWGEDRKKYNTTIELLHTEGTHFRPNMSVKARILLASLPNVLTVPVNAVTTHAGESFVWLAGPRDLPMRKQITIGQTSTDRVEVRSGLVEGDQVLVLSTEPHVGGSPAKDAASGSPHGSVVPKVGGSTQP